MADFGDWGTPKTSKPGSNQGGDRAGMHSMPTEVLCQILANVDHKDIARVRLVSKEFNIVMQDVRRHNGSTYVARLARKVANNSTGDCSYQGMFHPDAAEIFKLLKEYPTRKAEFNDALIAAWMEQNDVPAAQMAVWLDSMPVLRSGPANVNSVQLASLLSKYYD
jgi:hypothetical protein